MRKPHPTLIASSAPTIQLHLGCLSWKFSSLPEASLAGEWSRKISFFLLPASPHSNKISQLPIGFLTNIFIYFTLLLTIFQWFPSIYSIKFKFLSMASQFLHSLTPHYLSMFIFDQFLCTLLSLGFHLGSYFLLKTLLPLSSWYSPIQPSTDCPSIYPSIPPASLNYFSASQACLYIGITWGDLKTYRCPVSFSDCDWIGLEHGLGFRTDHCPTLYQIL